MTVTVIVDDSNPSIAYNHTTISTTVTNNTLLSLSIGDTLHNMSATGGTFEYIFQGIFIFLHQQLILTYIQKGTYVGIYDVLDEGDAPPYPPQWVCLLDGVETPAIFQIPPRAVPSIIRICFQDGLSADREHSIIFARTTGSGEFPVLFDYLEFLPLPQSEFITYPYIGITSDDQSVQNNGPMVTITTVDGAHALFPQSSVSSIHLSFNGEQIFILGQEDTQTSVCEGSGIVAIGEFTPSNTTVTGMYSVDKQTVQLFNVPRFANFPDEVQPGVQQGRILFGVDNLDQTIVHTIDITPGDQNVNWGIQTFVISNGTIGATLSTSQSAGKVRNGVLITAAILAFSVLAFVAAWRWFRSRRRRRARAQHSTHIEPLKCIPPTFFHAMITGNMAQEIKHRRANGRNLVIPPSKSQGQSNNTRVETQNIQQQRSVDVMVTTTPSADAESSADVQRVREEDSGVRGVGESETEHINHHVIVLPPAYTAT